MSPDEFKQIRKKFDVSNRDPSNQKNLQTILKPSWIDTNQQN